MDGRPACLAPIGLWVFAAGRWQLVETFDPSSREFNGAAHPATAVRLRACRTGRVLLSSDPRLARYELRVGRAVQG